MEAKLKWWDELYHGLDTLMWKYFIRNLVRWEETKYTTHVKVYNERGSRGPGEKMA